MRLACPLGKVAASEASRRKGKQGCAPPLVAYGDSHPKGEPRINANGSVLTVNNKLSYLKKSML